MKQILWPLVTLLGLTLVAPPLRSQTPPLAGLHGTGRAELAVRPERMLVTMDLTAKGTDVADALEKSKGIRAKAEAELTKLGAMKGSLTFGEPQVDPFDKQRREQMEELLRSRLSARRTGGKAPPIVSSVTVLLPVQAVFVLTTADPAAQLVEVAGLQARIKGIDLTAAKAAAELTPEEQELAEELAEAKLSYERGGGRKRGEPAFAFTATVGPEQRQKVMKEAFEAARAEVDALARASGTAVGPLRGARVEVTPGREGRETYDDEYVGRRELAAILRRRGLAGENDVVGMTFEQLALVVEVEAVFSITPN